MCKCVACKDAITNPICPDCLKKGMTNWIAGLKPKVWKELETKTSEISTTGDVKCIKCKKEMGLCPYCYTEYIHSWLKIEHCELARTFAEIFHFDLERKGYTKEIF